MQKEISFFFLHHKLKQDHCELMSADETENFLKFFSFDINHTILFVLRFYPSHSKR